MNKAIECKLLTVQVRAAVNYIKALPARTCTAVDSVAQCTAVLVRKALLARLVDVVALCCVALCTPAIVDTARRRRVAVRDDTASRVKFKQGVSLGV